MLLKLMVYGLLSVLTPRNDIRAASMNSKDAIRVTSFMGGQISDLACHHFHQRTSQAGRKLVGSIDLDTIKTITPQTP